MVRRLPRSVRKAKQSLKSSEVLANFDPEKQLILTCDASDYGISAILSHATEKGERPIAYASKTLTAAERKYAAIDKEARAIIFGVTKYYDYLYGRNFILKTDHQPLVRIFGPKKGIPMMATRRLQRYAIFLSAFKYQIMYTKSAENSADGLSRLPTPSDAEHQETEFTYLNYISQESEICLDDRVIARETRRDKTLAEVRRYIELGWPNKGTIASELKPYETRRDELAMEQDCIMWGHRVVVPGKLQPAVLKELHANHAGIVKMKSIARSFFWWPQIDKHIQELARGCRECAEVRDNPPTAKLHPWDWPKEP